MRARGFSLIEILVAASLLAIVGGMLVQSLSSSLDAKEAVEGTSNRYHLVRSAVSRMVDEISQAYLSAHVASAEARSETAFGYVPRVADEKKGDSRQLAYYLDTDPKTQTQSLLRREQANLDDNFEEGGRALVLLSDVRELTLEYWDATKEEWLDKWDAQGSDPNQASKLPQRVRLKITAVMGDGEQQTFMTQTRIWLPAPIKL